MAKSKAKKQRSVSFILIVVIVAFVVYFAVSLVSSAKEIQSKQALKSVFWDCLYEIIIALEFFLCYNVFVNTHKVGEVYLCLKK